jgi:hypothetical protein
MKNTCLALLLLSCLSTTVCAQEQAPKLLREAAHCLTAKKQDCQDWLDLENSRATALSFGYMLDAKSYPGEKVLYVVVYTGPGRSEGVVFAIFLTQQGGRRIFNIQNNARFVRSKYGIEGIDFVEPPLAVYGRRSTLWQPSNESNGSQGLQFPSATCSSHPLLPGASANTDNK